MTPSPQAGEPLAGTRYRLVKAIGSGAMGEVYEATDEVTGARCALKILAAHLAGHEGLSARVQREADVLAKVRHPNVVEVLDVGACDGRAYFTMPLLEGETLRTRMQRERIPWGEAAEIVALVLDGLGAAHAHGLVHRDVKPENVFLCRDGSVKVLDFGIAKSLTAEALTRSGVTLGTPRYMSPEQIEGRPVDPRSDLYSVGVLLYEVVAGAPPFDAAEPLTVALGHLRRAPPPLDARVPPALRGAIETAMRKRPDARYATAGELAATLRALAASTPRSMLERTAAGPAAAIDRSAPTRTVQPMPSTRTVRMGRHAAVTCRSLVVLHYVDVPTPSEVEAVGALVRSRAAELGERVVVVALVRSEIAVPPLASQQALMTTGRETAPHVSELHVVIEGEGFRSAAQRSVITSVFTVARTPVRPWVHKDVREASQRLAQVVPIGREQIEVLMSRSAVDDA